MSKVRNYILQECFSINLKWYRFHNNYTQEKLAELSNSTPKYISDLERGKFSPSLSKIQDIANALEIEPYILLKPDHYNSKIKSKRVDAKK